MLGAWAAGVAAAIVYPVLRYLVPPEIPEAATPSAPGGKAATLRPNSARIVPFGSVPAIIVRTAAGDYLAFSATCTHLACTVQYRAELQHIWCACHNGHYDLNGRNMFLFPLMRLSFGLTESPPPTQVSHRRVIVIWPLVNDPVHEFEPL